jgi:alpha-L-rhamnosidase
MNKVACLLLSIIFFNTSRAQQIDPSILHEQWKARWIAVPNEPSKEYGVYLFRKNIDVAGKPSSFVVHVSGDNRYKLFVNGTLVSLGPARSDLYYWNFETVDIAQYLKAGKNTLAAIVWNDGDDRPEGQISNRTGFVMQGNTEKESAVNTNDSWKCMRNARYKPLTGVGYYTYYVAGPGELVDMKRSVQGWMQNNFDDSKWLKASQHWSGASPKGIGDINGWMMVPSPLPQMERTTQRLKALRTSTGISAPQGFPATKASFTIAANTNAVLLLDQSFLTNAYVTLQFSKGKDAAITLKYAEALFERDPTGKGMQPKGNRDVVEGKYFVGRRDSIISSGEDEQDFTTLSYRTFRYIQLSVQTKDEPLTIDDLYGTFTGYPFKLNAKFSADNNDTLNKILEIGWRTARSCAMETYMDCPYYEQLQYIGDSRIQALVTLYNSGDDRLVRNAINQMDHSRIAEGITLSRHPSFSPQQIPTFSLWYIGMLHDYWMYRGDSNFIKDKLQGVENVLWFYSRYQQADGSLKGVPYWMFTDWVDDRKGWDGGTAPYGKDGSSAVLDFQLLWALQVAADMEKQLGSKEYASVYTIKAFQLQKTIRTKYWDAQKKFYADTDDKDLFSQHANALAILTNTIDGDPATFLAKRMLTDTSLAPASIYFKYYLHMACTKAGLGNDYLKWLDIWRDNIKMGMTTWAEISNISETRSDCHAWGASPNIEFYRTILGIDSDAPGFSKVKIEPHLGDLKNAKGSIPHSYGTIATSYKFDNGKWDIEISLPANTSGRFIWKGKTYPLKVGNNKFLL